MNLPRFTGEASLYKAKGHYQTGGQAVNLPMQINSAVSPAMIREETIDCRNCVGGECARLHCFDNWVRGETSGPYVGGSDRWIGGGKGSSGGIGGSTGTTGPGLPIPPRPPTGLDKAGKNCDRIEADGSSTYGKCETVCPYKPVTRDTVNNRWVCTR